MYEISVNGKDYQIPEIDYNAVCELDKYGVNLLSGETTNPFTLLRGYLALALKNKEAAGKEIESHIIKFGLNSINPMFETVSKSLLESGFLARMRGSAEKKEKVSKPKPKGKVVTVEKEIASNEQPEL